MNRNETTQDAFMIMERLGALCATQGINEETNSLANKQIQVLINKIIEPSIVKLAASYSGIIL